MALSRARICLPLWSPMQREPAHAVWIQRATHLKYSRSTQWSFRATATVRDDDDDVNHFGETLL